MDLQSVEAFGLEKLVAQVRAKEVCFEGYNSQHNLKGNCCCNCAHQLPVNGHPWNTVLNSPVTEVVGFACVPPDLYPHVTFFDKAHGMCECHSRKSQNVEGTI